MKKKLKFKLVRAAKEGGGDRYEHGVKKSPEFMVIYLPQYISRPAGYPVFQIEVTIKLD